MTLTVNGVRLYYEKTGSGPAMVLLHGNGEDHHIFDGLVARLACAYTCYALDSRGHGRSGPAQALGYEAMAEDTAAFITALGLQKPVLVGFSDGGIIGLLVAISCPGLLGGLVCCGANTRPGQLRWWFRAMCRLGWRLTGDPKLKMMLTEPDITGEALGRIQAPTLVLAGSHDILPQRDTRAIAAAIPGSTLRILRGEGHASYIRHSERLLAAMGPFLTEIGT